MLTIDNSSFLLSCVGNDSDVHGRLEVHECCVSRGRAQRLPALTRGAAAP